MKQSFFLLTILVILVACRAPQTTVATSNSKPIPVAKPIAAQVASPAALIYKTTQDYSRNVPVILSDDKKEIVSYPHPRDIYTNGELALPTPLADGYWLDNRGISENVAFLRYTYQEYAKLPDAPSATELFENIIDKNPLTTMWNCGLRHQFQNIEKELNEAIRSGQLESKYQKVK